MSRKNGPAHVVVDGSNIATEGRSLPSLKQLSEAVAGFMDEYPDATITVVVDATFGHRIDKSEVAEFEAGISNNELVAPPAGAVGRGDAFVLGIADKVGASILSNDSFQEFHGDYGWLFDEGRLIGGKPVPHIGWVFVDRVPVRGPVSRKATRGSGASSRGRGRGRGGRGEEATVRQGSKEASEPMPTPKTPPPSKKAAAKKSATKKAAATTQNEPSSNPRRAPRGDEPVNDLMPFLDFVEQHPVGTSVTGTVDAYSSHGAYVAIGDTDVRGYVPLAMMADPPPRSAKQILKQGESVTLVVVSFAATRRSIDCALPDMADAAIADAEAKDAADATTAGSGDTGGDGDSSATSTKTTAKKSPAKKTATKKKTAAKKAAGKKAAAKKSTGKKAAAKKTAAKKVAAKKSATKKKAAAKKTAVKKTAAKTTAAKKKSAAKKASAKKTAAKKTAAKKSSAKKAAASGGDA